MGLMDIQQQVLYFTEQTQISLLRLEITHLLEVKYYLQFILWLLHCPHCEQERIDRMEVYDLVVNFISTVGFPIGVAVYSLMRLEKTMSENTSVLSALCGKLDDLENR